MKRMLLAAALVVAASACSKNDQAAPDAGAQSPDGSTASAPAAARSFDADTPAPAPTEDMIRVARMQGPISVNFRGAGFVDQSFVMVAKVSPVSVTEVPFPARKRYEVRGESVVMLTAPGDVVYNYLAEQLERSSMRPMEKAASRAALGMRQLDIKAWKKGDLEQYPDQFVIEWCGDAWRLIEMECRSEPAPRQDLARWTQPAEQEPATDAPAAQADSVVDAQQGTAPSDSGREADLPAVPEEPDTTVVTEATVADMTAAPKYPAGEARQGIGGRVELTVQVDGNGNILDISVAKSSRNRNLDRAAMDAARQWTFHPARNAKGVGLTSKLNVPVDFDPPAQGGQLGGR